MSSRKDFARTFSALYETGDRQKLLEINANTARLQSELWSAVHAPAATHATAAIAWPWFQEVGSLVAIEDDF